MPELYGHPFKHELCAEIAELRNELWREQKKRADAEKAFSRAISKIVQLAAKSQRMHQKARELLSEAQEPNVSERNEAA